MECVDVQSLLFFSVGAFLALTLLGLVCLYLLLISKRRIEKLPELLDKLELEDQIEDKKHLKDTLVLLDVASFCYTAFQFAFLISLFILLVWALAVHFSI